MPLVAMTTSIGRGQSLSGAIDYADNSVVGLIMPAAWTAAHVSVLVSIDNVDFFDLFSFDGMAGTSPMEFKFNVMPGTIVGVDPYRMSMGRYIKFRSGTRAEPVPQAATRVFSVIVKQEIAA